jgi:hypothetical protein
VEKEACYDVVRQKNNERGEAKVYGFWCAVVDVSDATVGVAGAPEARRVTNPDEILAHLVESFMLSGIVEWHVAENKSVSRGDAGFW